MIEQTQSCLCGYSGVGGALQAAHRKWQRKRHTQHQIFAAILNQTLRDDIRLHIVRRHFNPPIALQRGLLVIRERGPIAVFGKVGGRRNCYQPCDTFRMRTCKQQRLPPPHGTAHNNQLALCQSTNRGHGILGPIAN